MTYFANKSSTNSVIPFASLDVEHIVHTVLSVYLQHASNDSINRVWVLLYVKRNRIAGHGSCPTTSLFICLRIYIFIRDFHITGFKWLNTSLKYLVIAIHNFI